jgi:hypothetical protein
MRVEDCIVTVERRSLGGCLDLACVFAREFSGPLFRLWLLCAVPALGLVWLLTSSRTDMMFPSMLVFLFFTAVFSSQLVCCMGPQVFGVPISVRHAIRAWRQRFWAWAAMTSMLRFLQAVSGFCFLLPSVFVTAFGAFLPEVLYLEKAPLNGVLMRLNWLAGGGGYSRNLARSLMLFAFWGLMTIAVFVLIDFLSGTLLNRPVFMNRFELQSESGDRQFEELVERFFQMLSDDPRLAVTVHLAAWLPYPVVRLTWFFAYLDQRIRNECWDLQLQCRAEAARVGTLT